VHHSWKLFGLRIEGCCVGLQLHSSVNVTDLRYFTVQTLLQAVDASLSYYAPPLIGDAFL